MMNSFAFTSSNYNPSLGGSEFLWTECCGLLAGQGHPTSALVGENYNDAAVSQLEEAGTQVTRNRLLMPGIAPRLAARFLPSRHQPRAPYAEVEWLREIERSGTPLIISLAGWGDGLTRYLPLARAGHPIALIVQLTVDHYFPPDKVVTANREVLEASRAVYCVSHRAVSDMRRSYALPLPQAQFVWNPMKLPAPTQLESPPAGIPGQDRPLKLACVARCDVTAKGQDVLLRALASEALRDAPIEVTFAGGGKHREMLTRMAEYLGLSNAHFAGHVSDLSALWAEHDAGVFPSRCEGLPNALLEAMHHARPSIVTDVGGNAEVTRDGIDGWVSPHASVVDISAALQRCLADAKRIEQMGEEAKREISKLMPANPVEEFAAKLTQDLQP